ncbi:hypothetical protein QF042_004759 [Pedobacter sp. W3I1]|nr:hypothetical protein [Pedobacter sp. W3I1]
MYKIKSVTGNVVYQIIQDRLKNSNADGIGDIREILVKLNLSGYIFTG